MANTRDLWNKHYAENPIGSGEGSIPPATIYYRNLIESFISLNRPTRVVELGCGDWQVASLIPWDKYNLSYLGLDASTFIVNRNIERFASKTVAFQAIDGPSDLMTLGKIDLLVCKDVLQHVPSAIVNQYLDCFQAITKVSIVTNDVFPSEHLNVDIEPMGWRPIDIREPPFSRKSFVIGEYANTFDRSFWVKQVHLLPGNAAQ